ncbi:MAG TPA: FtsX-like permease family protein [Syntrophomonadaceae bacterium]|nr:FtsX-like permease family protein [Syntrophomonadaceae bacterium]
MSALFKKLLRNISQGKGQFIAVLTIVVLGITVYVSMSSTYYNLQNSQEDLYQDGNFADHYFMVVKAPEQVIKDVEALSGVKRVTGRISLELSILKADKKRASARIVTYSSPMDNETNRIFLSAGRMFTDTTGGSGIEVAANEGFVEANQVKWGDNVTVAHEGKPIDLTIVGAANGPEFIYPIKDIADMLPDHKSFGIFMLPQYEAQQIFNLGGQINQVLIEFNPNVNQDEIVAEIKEILKPYGLLTSYPRDDQLSHAILQLELDTIKSLTLYLPIIFLLIAAAIQFIILRRMVKNQRAGIGVLKALGYSNRQIIVHYSTYALLVGFLGAALGSLLGLFLAGLITDYFQVFFNLPDSQGGYNLRAIIYGFLLSITVGLVAGWSASRQVIKIQPAESMRPSPPKMGTRNILERWPFLWEKFSFDWKISLRNISRNRGRFMLNTLGIMFAIGLLVVSYFMNDATDYMMNSFFHDQKYDLMMRVDNPVKEGELHSVEVIDGVLKVEPFLELPVRMNYKNNSEDDVLVAYAPGMTLKKIADEEGNKLNVPEEGMLINHVQAKNLGVSVGDDVEIETLLPNGPTHTSLIKVAGISYQMMGSATYVDIEVANRLLEEKGLVTGAMIKGEVGKTSFIEEELNEMLNISSISSLQTELDNFESNMEAIIYTVFIMVLFAVILGFAIVYNASLMTLIERERELASLKLIGYSNKELAGILGKENFLQAFIGVALGLPLGRVMAVGFMTSIESDLYSFPVIIYPLTYVFSAITAVVFILVAHRLAIRGINHINLVEILKSQD